LVHGARIQGGGEFNLELNVTLQIEGPILSINPLLLADEISTALNNYIELLKNDIQEQTRFAKKIRSYFQFEYNM